MPLIILPSPGIDEKKDIKDIILPPDPGAFS
jgi:hypothetical protein